MPKPARQAIHERREPGEQRGGERRHDEQHERARVGLGERSGDDAHRAGHRRRQHRVGHRELVRRQARRACRTPRSPTPPAWPARTGSSGTGRRARARSAPRRPPSRTGSPGSTCRTPRRCSSGKTLGICFDAEPNHSSIVACRISRIPSEATSLASGDDVRSGRNTSSSLSTPTRTDTSHRDDDRRGGRRA